MPQRARQSLLLEDKQQAYQFLTGLHRHLDRQLPGWRVMSGEIAAITQAAKDDKRQRHKRGAEHAFINHYAIPERRHGVKRRHGVRS